LKDKLNNVVAKMPRITQRELRNYAHSVRNNIAENAESAFSFPRPYLSTSIRVGTHGSGKYSISMPRYGWYVEEGTRPHAMPINPLQERWATMAGMTPWHLFLSVYDRGTAPRPFIKPAINKAMKETFDVGTRIIDGIIKASWR
jgi:hypothetical protein